MNRRSYCAINPAVRWVFRRAGRPFPRAGIPRRRLNSRFARPFNRCAAGRYWNVWRWSYWGPPEVYVREDQYFEGSLLIDLTQIVDKIPVVM